MKRSQKMLQTDPTKGVKQPAADVTKNSDQPNNINPPASKTEESKDQTKATDDKDKKGDATPPKMN